MIVGELYEGDDVPLAERQHDVYDRALTLLLRTIRRQYVDACFIAGVRTDCWPYDRRVDHRTVQWAHDFIAAAWRWRVSPPQRRLPLEGISDRSMHAWLSWLATEMESWRDVPDLVRGVVDVVARQNTLAGSVAEAHLSLALLRRYDDVPWKPALAAAFEADSRRLP